MKNDLLEEHVRYGESRFRDKNIVRPFVNRIYQDLAEVGRYPTTYNGADVIQVLLEVFNDKKELEAQLKSKESDLERQDMIIKCLNIDLDNKEKLLKEKDEDLELAMDELAIERGIKEYLANY